MADLPNSPNAQRNRRGCFVMVAVLVLFLALYLTVGLNGDPRNEVSEDIQAVPVK